MPASNQSSVNVSASELDRAAEIEALRADLTAAIAQAHSRRWRWVSNRYPHMVAMAYDGDIASALSDDDDVVAARVALYELRCGHQPRDWHAIGAEERDDT